MPTQSSAPVLAPLPMPDDRANNFWYVDEGADTVVVFVHGIFSSSRTCWTFNDRESGRSVFWPDLVRGDQRLGSPDIYLGGYHTSIDSSDYSLIDCATELRDSMRRRESGHSRAVYEARRLVFVGHSTGGIVVRYMINRYKEEFRDRCVGLALLASPSLGSKWADLFAAAAEHHGQRLGRQLSWDDSALQNLHWEFSELVNGRDKELPGLFGREAAEHHMIGRTRLPTWLQRLLPTRVKVVDKLSAGQYFGQVRQLAGTDHFSIAKPSGLNHPAHQFLVGFMDEFGAFADNLPPLPAQAASTNLPSTASAVSERGQEATAARPHIDDAEWPSARAVTVHLYIASAGFVPAATDAVVACVAVDGLEAFEERWRLSVASMLEDPHLGDDPDAAVALRRQEFGYEQAPALRRRIVEILRTLGFEAYVGFTRRHSDDNEMPAKLLDAVVFDRLRGYRERMVAVHVDSSDYDHSAVLSSATLRSSLRVRRLHEDAKEPIVVPVNVNARAPGEIVAQHVAAIVQERIAGKGAATAFNQIHPAKLRVIYDLESGKYSTRQDPFTG